jgi:hypothetical protein
LLRASIAISAKLSCLLRDPDRDLPMVCRTAFRMAGYARARLK